jgi:predicted TIM-barrel fold metal-dependent hydrolase
MKIIAAATLLILALPAFAQTEDIRDLKLKDWKPRSMMVTKETKVNKPAFPVVDIHNHLGSGKGRFTPENVKGMLAEMDAAGIRTVINLDGTWGDRLKETLQALDQSYPGRFYTFANIDFGGIDDEGWSKRQADQLEAGFKAGARGLKFYKQFGLGFRYRDGCLVPVDDPKLNMVWDVCAKYKRPVIIHTADPAAFWTPLDRFNERWHELNENPGWLFGGGKYPKREDLLAQLEKVIATHPRTTFISTHFGNNAEDLGAVARQLDKYPNMLVDIDARISELGRQPYTSRRFFLKYQDRIMFGTDTYPDREAYRIYFRFLETDDEYFDCARSHHLQGFWQIYGIFLPKDVLAKVYYKNADRLFAAGKTAAAQKTPARKVVSR